MRCNKCPFFRFFQTPHPESNNRSQQASRQQSNRFRIDLNRSVAIDRPRRSQSLPTHTHPKAHLIDRDYCLWPPSLSPRRERTATALPASFVIGYAHHHRKQAPKSMCACAAFRLAFGGRSVGRWDDKPQSWRLVGRVCLDRSISKAASKRRTATTREFRWLPPPNFSLLCSFCAFAPYSQPLTDASTHSHGPRTHHTQGRVVPSSQRRKSSKRRIIIRVRGDKQERSVERVMGMME